MLRRIVNGLRPVYYEVKASNRPNRLEEMKTLRNVRRYCLEELVQLDEEHRRLLLAIVFNKHKRSLLEATKVRYGKEKEEAIRKATREWSRSRARCA